MLHSRENSNNQSLQVDDHTAAASAALCGETLTRSVVCVKLTEPHYQASLTSVEVLWSLQFVTSFFAINSIKDNPSISNVI